MRVIVTGSEGFIGKHLCKELADNGHTVIRCDIAPSADEPLDITDADAVKNTASKLRPEVIINLAGQANVGASWKIPQKTVMLNTVGFLNIAEAVKETDKSIRIVAVGSADEYGRLGAQGDNVTEDTPLCPSNPYSVSKYGHVCGYLCQKPRAGYLPCKTVQHKRIWSGQGIYDTRFRLWDSRDGSRDKRVYIRWELGKRKRLHTYQRCLPRPETHSRKGA